MGATSCRLSASRQRLAAAAAASAVCLNLGVSHQVIKKSLRKFTGVQRRMTKIFSKNHNDFYDDYAHHPTEIRSILEGVKNAYNIFLNKFKSELLIII